jgi:hypothetical protein
VPQIYSRPRSEPVTYSLIAPSAEGAISIENISTRRWPLWILRFLLWIGLASCPFLIWEALGNTEGRELLALGVITLTTAGLVFFSWAHETINKAGKSPRTRPMRVALTAGASCVSIWMFLRGNQADAVHARTKARHASRPLPGALDTAAGLSIHEDHVTSLPCFTARMTGASQAPIGLVFLGSGHDLLDAFEHAGWHAAERITWRTAFRAFGRGVMNRPYHSAPVFPSFLDGNLHDVAFQQTTPGGSSRRRHHARWWLTDFTCEGKQVWVATASYDAGVGVGRLLPIPIHHIDPDIDAERDYIAASLSATDRVRITQEVRITQPMAGKNSAGDPFYTQGMALVLA